MHSLGILAQRKKVHVHWIQPGMKEQGNLTSTPKKQKKKEHTTYSLKLKHLDDVP